MLFCDRLLSSDECSQKLFHCLLCKWLKFQKIMPTVYASSDANDGELKESTSVDQLESARPKIIITEDEVIRFLDNETGRDRIRAMFMKE